MSPEPEEEVSQDPDDDEISEYKRVRLLDQRKAHWTLLARARHLLKPVDGRSLVTAYHGPPVYEDTLTHLLGKFPLWNPLSFEQRTTPLASEAYFEIKAVGGDPCVGFCTELSSIKRHPGWEGSYTYDCSNGLLFASSVVGIRRYGSAGGPGLTSNDVVGFGLSRSLGSVFINDKLIRELVALRGSGIVRLAELCLDTFTIKERHRALPMHPVIGLRGEHVQVVARFDRPMLKVLREVRDQMVVKRRVYSRRPWLG